MITANVNQREQPPAPPPESESPREPEVEQERERERRREDEACPECGGRPAVDEERGETACVDCGLVLSEDAIDRGPEWRAFDGEERGAKSRVGAPSTLMLHDKGLSTGIGWQDRDAYGKALTSRQRRRINRMRTWDERFRTRNHKERNLKQALGEIDRMASALGLPDNVRETASVIYRRALNDGLLPGRSIEGVATASLYAAARTAGTPRSIDEVVAVSRIDDLEFRRTYRYVVRELGLEVLPADPESYVARFASELGLSDEVERRAHELLAAGRDREVHVGKNPVGLAAAAIYAAGLLTNEKATQSEVADVADVSEVTIRNRYKELLDAAEAEQSAF
ncbi:transcription initiation factor IIB [Halegenticoccus soli]|uniref:transcription initiation factor IIB n=1 Tax=Halegenticoccus soli TaxID=1985678 RepID=UPI000C6E2B43|nr:transcription initiation factor IIB [Halegenticoccus soli]